MQTQCIALITPLDLILIMSSGLFVGCLVANYGTNSP